MRKYFIVPILFAALLIGISSCSCKRNFEKEFSGPLLCPTDNFAMTTPLAVAAASSGSSANFASATEAVLITAQFNESIGWTVRIKGNTSGAVKTYTGTSNQISLSWVGQPDKAPFFVAEPITVDLILACKQEIYDSEGFTISTPTFLQLPGFMNDFDVSKSSPLTPGVNGNANSASLKRVQPGNPLNIGVSPQGGSYFNIHSGNEPTPVWYYGGFEINPPAAAIATMTPLPGLNSDPSTVYLNFYANSNGVSNSQIQVAVIEHYKTPDAENNKSRKANVNLDWNGWKMVSIKLSDIGILDPRKIAGIQFGLGAYLHRDQVAEANLDMVIITNDAPLLGN